MIPEKEGSRRCMKPNRRLTRVLVPVIVLVGKFAATAGTFPGR